MRKLSGLGERRKARSEGGGEKEALIGQVGPVAFVTKKADSISKFFLPPPTRFTFCSLFFPQPIRAITPLLKVLRLISDY